MPEIIPADAEKPNLLSLAHACERTATRARANLADRDAGREEKTALFRAEIDKLRKELEKWG